MNNAHTYRMINNMQRRGNKKENFENNETDLLEIFD